MFAILGVVLHGLATVHDIPEVVHFDQRLSEPLSANGEQVTRVKLAVDAVVIVSGEMYNLLVAWKTEKEHHKRSEFVYIRE